VYDHADYPFLNGVIQLLKQRLAADLPTLGICLGCQLIAAALGAEVYPSGHQEIGWKIIQLTKQGQESCLQALSTQAVLHWHGDTFDLPQGATHLAASDRCHNQAFALGRTLALQFHPEVTAQGLERWLVGHSHQLQSLSLSVTGLRADNQRYAPRLQPHGSLMLERWLHSVEN
jgi:GMP synthase (glutamine-hydrolysing)